MNNKKKIKFDNPELICNAYGLIFAKFYLKTQLIHTKEGEYLKV